MMGMGPREIDRMTMAQFRAMLKGFARFNGAAESEEAPSRDEYLAVLGEYIAKGQA